MRSGFSKSIRDRTNEESGEPAIRLQRFHHMELNEPQQQKITCRSTICP